MSYRIDRPLRSDPRITHGNEWYAGFTASRARYRSDMRRDPDGHAAMCLANICERDRIDGTADRYADVLQICLPSGRYVVDLRRL